MMLDIGDRVMLSVDAFWVPAGAIGTVEFIEDYDTGHGPSIWVRTDRAFSLQDAVSDDPSTLDIFVFSSDILTRVDL